MPYSLPVFPLVFFLVSIPLVLEDLATLSVPTWKLFVAMGVLVALRLLLGQSDLYFQLALSSGALTLGTLVLVLVPSSLGEADVIYIAGLAWLVSFWGLLLAVGMACVLVGANVLVTTACRRSEPNSEPVAFLPFLFLGGLAALVGGP
jgi:hypothetical protein